MGEVYRARQLSMDREVAIKVLRRQFAKDREATGRFLREVRVVSQLTHPNTVTVYDSGQTGDGLLYIVMELLAGRLLTDAIGAEAPMPPEVALPLVAQIAGALAEAHDKGIVHRDLKPDNVMLAELGGWRDQVKEEVPAFASFGVEVPETVEALVRWLLEKLPEDRPGSARELVERIDSLSRHRASTQAACTPSLAAGPPAFQPLAAPAVAPGRDGAALTLPDLSAPGTILVVAEEALDRDLLASLLVSDGHAALRAATAGAAARVLADREVDVVLLACAGRRGIEDCQRLCGQLEGAGVPLMAVCDYEDREARMLGIEAGCADLVSKPVDPLELSARVRNLVQLRRYRELGERRQEMLGREVEATGAELRFALANLEEAEEETRRTREEAVSLLARLVALRGDETERHITRVTRYSALLARRIGLREERCQLIEVASALHDIGKIGVPDGILTRRGHHTAEEFEVMREHTNLGHELLAGARSEMLQVAATIARTHHEQYDGSGYPRGLKGRQIPMEGRICAIADVFDSLTTRKVYKPAFPDQESLRILMAGRGRHFDPTLLDLFVCVWDDVLAVKEELRDEDE